MVTEERDGNFTPSEGYTLCEECGGRGTHTCEDCDGDGNTTRMCDLGHEHTDDCGSCDQGSVDCYNCEGTGELLDPDLELDATL